MRIQFKAIIGFAIVLLALILWCFSELGDSMDFREKLISSLLGTAISGFLVVVGWIITFKNSIDQQALNFEKQNYEKIISKILEKIEAYLQWMYDLEGRLEIIKKTGDPERIVSMVVDWDKFSEFFINMQVIDRRNRDWSNAIITNLPIIGFPFYSYRTLAIRQTEITKITRSISYCCTEESLSGKQSYIQTAFDQQKYLSEQIDQVVMLKQYFVQEYHKHFFKDKLKLEMLSEVIFDRETGKIIISNRLEL